MYGLENLQYARAMTLVHDIYAYDIVKVDIVPMLALLDECIENKKTLDGIQGLLLDAKGRIEVLEQQLQKAKLRAVQRKTELKKERSKK